MINEIASIAHSIKKPSKRLAFDTLKYLINNPGDQQALGKLYAYFLPPITKIKKPEDWISKAIGIKDIRYYLNYLYSDGSRLIGTDGHRLHVMPTSLEPGFYNTELVKIHDPDWSKYPEIDQVIPSKSGKSCKFNDLLIKNISDLDCFVIPDGHAMQCKYVKEAMLGLDNPTFYYSEIKRAVLVDDGIKFAVIMPVNQ